MLCSFRDFVRANDIVNGFEKLNLPFVASLFNKYPALDEPEELPEMPDLLGTREERMYMNWMKRRREWKTLQGKPLQSDTTRV